MPRRKPARLPPWSELQISANSTITLNQKNSYIHNLFGNNVFKRLKACATGLYRPRVCKNVFEGDRYSKPDWKLRFYAKSISADVPINFRFNADAHTSILAKRFYTLWANSCLSQTTTTGKVFTVDGINPAEDLTIYNK